MARRRSLGHITKAENRKVQRAIENAKKSCKRELDLERKYVCLHAVEQVRRELKAAGFQTTLYQIDGVATIQLGRCNSIESKA